MHPSGPPSNPGGYLPPQPPNESRSAVRKIVGWVLVVLGALLALGGLFGGTGFGGRIGGLLIGLTIAALGAMLIRPFTSWKIAGPGAALAVVLGALLLPPAPKDATPAAGLVGPTSTTTVTSSATVTVTASTTTSTPPSSTATSSAPVTTTTTTVAAPPNPGITETNTRTPVPTAPRVEPPTSTSDAPSVHYNNCAAAKAAGAAPMRRGEPGYRPALDRDGDGIACDK